MTAKYKTKGLGPEFDSSGYSAPRMGYLETPVRFSLRYCDTSDYCLSKLTDSNEAKKFIETMGKFEDMTWGQLRQIAHEKGISIEKKDSSNHSMLKARNESFDTFGHFRVSGLPNPFRVFGAEQSGLFYVLLLDREGNINH
jgi:hypothetical protein